jgi:DNA polymerase III delta subunit
MPKLELKAVQKELEQETLWPVYWIYGPEKLKSRELLKRIRTVVLGKESEKSTAWGWSEEVFEGTETDASSVVDAALSPSLGGEIRLIVVRDAHALKGPESLTELFGPAQKKTELMSVCVCLSKDLDARKKFSKALIEKAAVVPCEEVTEDQRESWIQFLAKRRKLEVKPHLLLQLRSLDPWSLDIVDQELEKYAVAGQSEDVMLEGIKEYEGAEKFIFDFLSRNLKVALPQVGYFASHPDESLPLLGLLTWNVRQLALFLADREQGTRYVKLNPFLVERFKKWSACWKLSEIQQLQQELFELDFKVKQTPLLPLGLWSSLVTRYCR